MANKLSLGLVIGGAVDSTVGAAFKDVSGEMKQLEAGKPAPGAAENHRRDHASAR